MDGNRRWAQEKGLSSWQGHQEGVQALYRTIKACLKHDIKTLSVYALSIQNLSRTQTELSFIFSLIVHEALQVEQMLIENEIKIQFVGDQALWPESVIGTINELQAKTRHHTKLQVNILFCYGSQEEIVDGVKNIARDLLAGQLSIDEITKELFARRLWMNSMAPDLIIRTGKERRLSNFLLYQAAYSELCFLDLYWPEITEVQIESAISCFTKRKRRFGA